ncbi:MAG: hypothetical protein AB1798_19655, partial [Spirochaetota bacterium]
MTFSGKKAVLSNRFISWDKFKEQVFSINRDVRPVNTHLRYLFVASFLQKNKPENPVLKKIVHPDYAGNSLSFLRYIVALLPSLKKFRELYKKRTAKKTQKKTDCVEESLLSDLELLWDSYSAFLTANSLFEPSYEKPDLDLKKSYLLFFPGIIEDFNDFRRDLIKNPSIRIVPEAENGEASITVFDTSLNECRWIMAEITTHLKKGLGADELVITVPDGEILELLASQASLYDIPLDIRRGKSLADYPQGKLFSLVQECETSGHSLEALKRLLLNRAFPWREEEKAKKLIDFGVQYHCSRNYNVAGEYKNLWLYNLKRLQQLDLASYYKKLSGAIKSLWEADNFTTLKQKIGMFSSLFFNASGWDEPGLKIFQSCLKLLDELEAASLSISGMDSIHPLNLFISALSEKIYVVKPGGPGIGVYPYRVSAGIDVPCHFIMGASHTSLQVHIPSFGFLREDQKEALDVPDSDLTDAFIKTYAGSGKSVLFSCSLETPSGAALLPGYFISRRKINPFSNYTALWANDSYKQEIDLWGGTRERIQDRFYAVQKTGMEYFSNTALTVKKMDFSRRPVQDKELNRRLQYYQQDDEGCLIISPTSLEAYIA